MFILYYQQVTDVPQPLRISTITAPNNVMVPPRLMMQGPFADIAVMLFRNLYLEIQYSIAITKSKEEVFLMA